MRNVNAEKIKRYVNAAWDDEILPVLREYVKVPNKSPDFDPAWEDHGYMDDAIGILERWCRQQPIRGLTVEACRLPHRTPLLMVEIAGASDDTVLLYGHYDKQPEFSGWAEGLHPWQPVMRDGRLYGRGGADDGYAVFAALAAIRALQEQNLPHARCVVLIEGSEESGSCDLPAYINLLENRLGSPSLIICLDGECGNYEQLWCTTSLRGSFSGTLSVEVLSEGVHSGTASGIVPSSFRIIRQLLSRIEDEETGRIVPESLYVDIPAERQAQAESAASILRESVYRKFPWTVEDPVPGGPLAELLLDSTWHPTMCVTGAEGLPDIVDAGSVLLPQTTLKLSFRVPPTCDVESAAGAVKQLLERDTPANVRVRFKTDSSASGWNAPPISPSLEASLHGSSTNFFHQPAMFIGTGGTIPFMAMLGERFPDAQVVVTGVLGPGSNAHGPNEFLHIDCGKRLTACVAQLVMEHFEHD